MKKFALALLALAVLGSTAAAQMAAAATPEQSATVAPATESAAIVQYRAMAAVSS